MGCLAAVGTNTVLPIIERPTPDGLWRECSMDFKGFIGGKYYLHAIQDNLSRWPEIKVVESASFAKLRPDGEKFWYVRNPGQNYT